MRDRGSGFLIITLIAPKDAVTVQESVEEHVIAKLGVPREIVTDNGKEFCSQMFEVLTKLLVIKNKHTMAYHPQSNDFIKCAHRFLKSSLRALKDPTTYQQQLSDNNLFTPNQQIFGQAVRLPGVIIFSPLEEKGCPTTAEFFASSENILKHENKRRPLPNIKSFNIKFILKNESC